MKRLKKIVLRIVVVVIAAGAAGLFLYGSYQGYLRRHKIDVIDNLDKTAVTIDGEELTLKDLGFYFLYEEKKVEDEAYVYNKKRTRDFWNIHTNGFFLQGTAKEAVIGMAIHDRIFYRLAQEEHIVLSTEEKEKLEDARTDFWNDLYEIQKKELPGDYASINRTMKEIAFAEKYQQKLSLEMDTTYAGLNWDGYDYENDIKEKHDIRINDKVWHRVIMGDITLAHDDVSYINAFDEKEQEK